MLSRLATRREASQHLVWGTRAPRHFKVRRAGMARFMGVPTNRLIMYALRDWAEANATTLLDGESRRRLADKIDKAYLDGKLG